MEGLYEYNKRNIRESNITRKMQDNDRYIERSTNIQGGNNKWELIFRGK